MTDSNLTDLEKEVFAFLQSEAPVYQSDLWKELDMSSRSGSRVAQSLSENGLIEREETRKDGRKTFRLTVIDEDASDESEWDAEATAETVELPSHDASLSPTQEEAALLVYSRGEITQSNLWKTLGVASRTGTRASRALVDAGLITREETHRDGQNTFLLRPIESGDSDSGEASQSCELREGKKDLPDELSLTDTELQAYRHIKKVSGMPQNSLQSHIDGDPEMVDEIVESLLANDLIIRTRKRYYGRDTYWVKPSSDTDSAVT